MTSRILILGFLFALTLTARAQTPASPAVITPTDGSAQSAAADRLGFKLAIHSYTFRKFTIDEAIRKTAALGIKYMSISGHLSFDGKTQLSTADLTDDQIRAIRQKVAAAGLTLVNIGVMDLPPNEAKSRKVFEVAKKLGVDVIVAEPPEPALDLVEKLAEEYKIKVAIHDHPIPNHYWNPDVVMAAIKGRPMLGACADVGHWVRSGLDPVASLKKLEGRVIALHFKDLNEMGKKDAHDVPWGTGISNVVGQLTELKRQGFHGAICFEYEYNWDNSSPEIAESIKFFNATCLQLQR
jgi:sugar phosphate isomerase/epimerase